MNADTEILAMLDEVRSRLAAREPEGNMTKTCRASRVRDMIAGRRRRERIFADTLFADPAWDILLGLYEDDLRGRSSFVKDACIASSVPATTALRWIVVLEREGLIERSGNQTDRRRVGLRLTEVGRDCMERYFVDR